MLSMDNEDLRDMVKSSRWIEAYGIVQRFKFGKEILDEISIANRVDPNRFMFGGAYAARRDLPWVIEMLHTDPIYRVYIKEDQTVTTYSYELLENFAPELEKEYKSIDDLPKWAQDKLAVLMVCEPSSAKVDGVGRRISKDVFWLFKGT